MRSKSAKVIASALWAIVFATAPVIADEGKPQPANSVFVPSNYGGGDGATQATAVQVRIGHSFGGIKSEYVWLKEKYPTWKILRQHYIRVPEPNSTMIRSFDKFDLENSEGKTREVWFDLGTN